LAKFIAVNFDKVHCYVAPTLQVCLALHSTCISRSAGNSTMRGMLHI